MFLEKNFEGIEYSDSNDHDQYSPNNKLTMLAYSLFDAQAAGVTIQYDALVDFLGGTEGAKEEDLTKFFDFGNTMKDTKVSVAKLMGEFIEAYKSDIDEEVAERLLCIARDESEPNYPVGFNSHEIIKKINDVIQEILFSHSKVADSTALAQSLSQAVEQSDQGGFEAHVE